MITETLSLLCGSDLISDSALKVVFSYYPVCRCQRTSPASAGVNRSRTFQTTKKPNFESDLNSVCRVIAFADAAPINLVGTKLSSNLQSQNVRRTHSNLMEPRFRGIVKITIDERLSTAFAEILPGIFLRCMCLMQNPLHRQTL